jgi:hypothetical protein
MNLKLKALIILKFGTQEDFAAAVNEGSSLVSLVVRGRRLISDEKKERWSEVLGCEPHEIFPDQDATENGKNKND